MNTERFKTIEEEMEYKRLNKLFKGIPKSQKHLVQGLIQEAARLRIALNQLWEDIQENGMTELFTQSNKVEPFLKERVEAKLFAAYDKNYQSIIKQLTNLLPSDDRQERTLADEMRRIMNED